MTTDRPTHKLTARDTRTRQWLTTLELKPTDLWLTLQPREHSYETHHSDVPGGTHCSRVDDWLFSTSQELGISDTVFPSRTHVRSDIPHTSDHHPVVLTVDRTQIPIIDTSYDPETKAKTVIRRIKQTVTRDMFDSLKDTLSNETREDVESLGRAVARAQGENRASGKAMVREISLVVDNLLAKAWEITLREVGETVTIGDTHPVKGRSNQSGHLKNTSKRTYKQLLTHLRKVRKQSSLGSQ